MMGSIKKEVDMEVQEFICKLRLYYYYNERINKYKNDIEWFESEKGRVKSCSPLLIEDRSQPRSITEIIAYYDDLIETAKAKITEMMIITGEVKAVMEQLDVDDRKMWLSIYASGKNKATWQYWWLRSKRFKGYAGKQVTFEKWKKGIIAKM